MARPEGPSLDRLYSIRVDGSRNFLHPADVRGRFLTWRRVVFASLIGIYLILPLIEVGGHPAVHLDIASRHFHLFGRVFNSQDFWIVIFLVTGFAFSLLFFTTWLGRVWCGWACPQTVFLEAIYRPIERLIEGPGEKRIRLDQGPWTANKVLRKAAKHALFVLVSLFIAHVAISLFVSGRSLLDMMRHDPRQHWEAFAWTMAVAAGFYFNFFWFREQLCIVVCPYGRLQSTLTDRDSLIIGYDQRRGEPRGRMGRGADGKLERADGKGDCIDCNRCVAVCPTGIDIRNGLQLECIGCTQCIDACDEVMDKVSRPRGLIRYDSHNGLHGEPKRRLRGRLVLYGLLMTVSLVGFTLSMALRRPFEANLIRTRGAPWIVDEKAGVRNQFELHLVNKNPSPATFRVSIQTPMASEAVIPQREITLDPLASARAPIFITVSPSDFKGPFGFSVEVIDANTGVAKEIAGRFLGPAGGMPPPSP